MMTLACKCEEGLGVPHTHLTKWGCYKYKRQINNSVNYVVMVVDCETDIDDPQGVWTSVPIPDQIKICVDWERVAKELMRADP